MEDALLPYKQEATGSSPVPPTNVFSKLEPCQVLGTGLCPHKCPHKSGFFSSSPGRIYPRGRTSARLSGLCRCALVHGARPITEGETTRREQESRGRGDTAQRGLGDLAGHLCLTTEAEAVGPPGLDPTPRFFYLRFRHPCTSAQGRPVAEGEPAGLAGRKPDRLVDQPFAVRQDLERLALHCRAGKIRRKWLS